MTVKDLMADHAEKVMELGILVFVFVFATIMLALFPMREEMARWIENGAIVAILARAFGTAAAPTTVVTKVPPNEDIPEKKP